MHHVILYSIHIELTFRLSSSVVTVPSIHIELTFRLSSSDCTEYKVIRIIVYSI